ncbi:hypothetical protein [Pseudorhizobium marinum]|uniref:hypothetical protein n=1 Tax=Pseudorhizobium marinum TaxID=1496690 RepID=UPI00138DFE8F|nr:hypothetical protein [Pseudorhizobium marinum]
MSFELPNTPRAGTVELIRSLRKLADDLELYVDLGPGAVDAETNISGWTIAKRAVPALLGVVRGHPSIKDGDVAVSTQIMFFSLEHRLARSQNRWYRLGEPMFPIEGTRQ